MVDFSMMVGIVMGVSQLLKKTGLNTQIIPIFNVLVGMLLSILCMDLSLMESLQQGLLIGLSASGVYDVCTSFKKKY